MNLLKDFDGIADWIIACKDILPEYVDVLGRHEVLRMCEGVAKILLRKPDEVISMVSNIRSAKNITGKWPAFCCWLMSLYSAMNFRYHG